MTAQAGQVKKVLDDLVHRVDIKNIMIFHSLVSIAMGVPLVLIPHSFYNITMQLVRRRNVRTSIDYSHIAHEYLRMYGALLMGVGWIVWRSRNLKDSRLQKIFCESFALIYLVEAVIMARAEYTTDDGHSAIHILIIISFMLTGLMYAIMRFWKGIKHNGLPGTHDD